MKRLLNTLFLESFIPLSRELLMFFLQRRDYDACGAVVKRGITLDGYGLIAEVERIQFDQSPRKLHLEQHLRGENCLTTTGKTMSNGDDAQPARPGQTCVLDDQLRLRWVADLNSEAWTRSQVSEHSDDHVHSEEP